MASEQSETSPLLEAQAYFRKGDYLKSFDISNRAIEKGMRSPDIIYLSILSLARSGATHEAIETLHRFKNELPRTEDIGALEARLMKDQFRSARNPDDRIKHCRKARDAYLAVYNETRGYFPAINAATLSLFLGEEKVAAKLANETLGLCGSADNSDYWAHATRAEAALILSDLVAVGEHLKRGVELKRDDFASQATTYRQLALICEHRGITLDVLSLIQPPAVIHYTGHMIFGMGSSPGIREQDEAVLKTKVSEILEARRVHYAFGALACGADIIVAEEVLRRGGELRIILPFGAKEFKEISVAPAGEKWCKRFDEVLSRVASVYCVVDEGHCDQELLFQTAALEAMGSAILRARTFGSKLFQLALWNGLESSGNCGTGSDVKTWKAQGLESQIIEVQFENDSPSQQLASAPYCDPSVHRELQALVFADIRGFSQLRESEVAIFMNYWFKVISQIMADYGQEISFVNTWGDAVFFVVKSTRAAAKISLNLAHSMKSSAWEALGLPVKGIRVSAHAGPVFVVQDPILMRQSFYGMHVNKTARMEPCTPVGHVYVTEEFAALVTIESGSEFVCEYAGEHTLPKNFGKFRMYHLAT